MLIKDSVEEPLRDLISLDLKDNVKCFFIHFDDYYIITERIEIW